MSKSKNQKAEPKFESGQTVYLGLAPYVVVKVEDRGYGYGYDMISETGERQFYYERSLTAKPCTLALKRELAETKKELSDRIRTVAALDLTERGELEKRLRWSIDTLDVPPIGFSFLYPLVVVTIILGIYHLIFN